MDPEGAKPEASGVRRVLEIGAAALGLLLAGPALAAIITAVVIGFFLCACAAAVTVYGPIAMVQERPRWASETARAHATATDVAEFKSLRATATAYSLPGQVETLIAADEASRWALSPDGEHLAIVFWDEDRAGVMSLRTRETRFVDIPEVPPKNASYRDLRRSDPLWLDERRLVISLSCFSSEDGSCPFRLLEVGGSGALELREFRLREVEASQVAGADVAGKELFDVASHSLSNLRAVALDGTGGLVIVGRDDEARRVLGELGPNAAIAKSTPPAEWRFLERTHSPDGAYYASVWPDGERLAILREGGDIVAETLARDYGPTQVGCDVQPIGWMPDSSGVLFRARCEAYYSLASQKAVLVLPVPGE
jgi:hypothetical protein